MFTGIVEDIGVVRSIRAERGVNRIDVDTALDLSDTKLGDSIACNGVCLTITHNAAGPRGGARATFDVGPESQAVSTLGALSVGDHLHLERAVRLSDRLGGHLVQGHVDAIGTVCNRSMQGETLELEVDLPREALRLCINKGSIALDGVSLTINAVTARSVRVWLIPHTLEGTRLASLRVGDKLNVETDLIGKYVARLLDAPKEGITMDFLAKHGFGSGS